MNQNAALLTTTAEAELDATISNYGAGVFAHVNGDWQQHSQFVVYPTPYTVPTTFTTAGTILVTIFKSARDTGSDIVLNTVLGTFTSLFINFFTVTNGNWYPFVRRGQSFGASMTGAWTVAAAGTYTFRLGAEWGAYLWIDNKLVINNGQLGGQHGFSSKQGSTFLSAGNHTFLVKYWTAGPPPSGVELTVPAGIILATSPVITYLKTVAQNSLVMSLDYVDLNGNAATESVVLPAILTGLAPPSVPTPIIITQPVSQTVALNGATAFSVVAISSLKITYQWYFNDVAIAGATSSALAIINATAAQAGNYFVAVINANGSTDSNTVTLTVTT
jgi:PA14 domain